MLEGAKVEIIFVGYILGTALSLVFYLLPLMIAFYRDHQKYTTIFLVNLLLGWTVVVWFICLIWALFGASRVKVISEAPNKYEDLKRLSRLRSSGDLTSAEYEVEKARLLNR